MTVRASSLISKSKNTPFDGWTLRGGTAATVVGGRVLYVNADLSGLEALSRLMPANPTPRPR